MSGTEVLKPFYDGWENHQRLLVASIADLHEDQLALRAAPEEMSIWQIASHMAGSRAFWFHDVLGEGDSAIRDMFRVSQTTVPGLPLEQAGWEDDETHPRTAAEIVEAFGKTWNMIDECLQRWSAHDLAVELRGGSGAATSTRGWVIWHLIEHEAHHGGAISLILGTNGLPGLDL